MVTKVKKKIKKNKVKIVKTNPNGANQYLLDPRQDLFWEIYTDPRSPTFSNATQSAIKVGYTKAVANQITTQLWFIGKIRRMNLLNKAEKVLEKTLTMETIRPVIGQFGPIMIPTGQFNEKGKEKKELLYDENDKLLKIQQDSAKFVAATRGKKDGWGKEKEDDGSRAVEIKQIIIINPNKPEDQAIYNSLKLNAG